MKTLKILVAALTTVILFFIYMTPAFAGQTEKCVRIAFTHDIHSHIDISSGVENGEKRELGGASRLSTLLKKHNREFSGDTIYLDGGDFSQGTLFQSGYITSASEFNTLVELGCSAVTPGNHEWDLSGNGLAEMLNTAMERNEDLPAFLIANIDFTGELNDEQQHVKETLERYRKKSGQDDTGHTVITTPGGVKLGLFGVSGPNSIEDSPTSGMKWLDYIETAQKEVEALKGNCDIIICLSHSGTDGDGENGDDIKLAEKCPDINMILSAHSHTMYKEPVYVGNTLIASCGDNLGYMGYTDAVIGSDGNVRFENYALERIDESVECDSKIQDLIDGYKTEVERNYLSRFGYGYDQILAHSSFDFVSLDEMYATHDEYPMGDLIADAYIYEAEKNGINDIDVALVGLGTIRGAFREGNISVADTFENCSLGVGADGSAGHPILGAYITGSELKLLAELDASLGPLVSSIKMSYSGLEYKFNEERALLDRVTEIHLLRRNGKTEEIEDDKLYKVSCNMYAANMLGMLNGLTKGALKIVPKYENGTPVEDFYDCSLLDKERNEIKEWVAVADYISSFEKNADGIAEIPSIYKAKQGRKVKYAKRGLDQIANPGATTIAVMTIAVLLLFAIILIVNKTVKKNRKKADNRDGW